MCSSGFGTVFLCVCVTWSVKSMFNSTCSTKNSSELPRQQIKSMFFLWVTDCSKLVCHAGWGGPARLWKVASMCTLQNLLLLRWVLKGSKSHSLAVERGSVHCSLWILTWWEFYAGGGCLPWSKRSWAESNEACGTFEGNELSFLGSWTLEEQKHTLATGGCVWLRA